MTTKHFGLLAVAVAVSLNLLAPYVAHAAKPAEPQDFTATWLGTYYDAGGNQIPLSRLTLRVDANGASGEWDDYPVIGSFRDGNTLILKLAPAPPGRAPTPGVDHYRVVCTYNPNRTLSVVYDGMDANENPTAGVHGGTANGEGFVKP